MLGGVCPALPQIAVQLVALGAALFVVSDSFIAADKFDRPVPRAELWVMATYLLAQAGIVGGLALR